jgi:hypothetical protein
VGGVFGTKAATPLPGPGVWERAAPSQQPRHLPAATSAESCLPAPDSGFWEAGIPVGPFRSRETGSASSFVCLQFAITCNLGHWLTTCLPLPSVRGGGGGGYMLGGFGRGALACPLLLSGSRQPIRR